jgi:hypothetical protein
MSYKQEYGYEWRDQVKDTKYPFSDNSTLLTASNLLIDKSAIYDASFYLVNWSSRLFITSIEIATGVGPELKIYVGNSSNKKAAVATLDPFSIPEVITFTDTLGRPAGIMVVDSVAMAFLQTWPIGEHILREAAEFVPSVVLTMSGEAVSSLRSYDNELVNGNVWLIGEDGVVLRLEDGNIRVDIVGDTLFKRRDNPESFITPRFIKTINNVPPDEHGDYKIVVGNFQASDTILRIYPDPSLPGIRVELVGQDLQAIVG